MFISSGNFRIVSRRSTAGVEVLLDVSRINQIHPQLRPCRSGTIVATCPACPGSFPIPAKGHSGFARCLSSRRVASRYAWEPWRSVSLGLGSSRFRNAEFQGKEAVRPKARAGSGRGRGCQPLCLPSGLALLRWPLSRLGRRQVGTHRRCVLHSLRSARRPLRKFSFGNYAA